MEKNSKVIKYINIIKTEFNYIDDYNKDKKFLEMLSRTFEFIVNKKKSKIVASVKGYMEKPFDTELFFNGSFFRIDELIESALVNFKKGNLLTSIICSRQLVETIATVFYLIEHSKKYLNGGEINEHFILLWKLAADKANKRINIMEILRFYNKFINESVNDNDLTKRIYSQSSAITHPNYEGTWGFYSKSYDNNRWLFKNDQEQSRIKCEVSLMNFLFILPQMCDHIISYEKFLKDKWPNIKYYYTLNSDYALELEELRKEILDIEK